MFVNDAVFQNADAITFELDKELHLKVREEMKSLKQLLDNGAQTVDRYFFELNKLPKAFGISFRIGEVQDPLPSANGELFGNVIRILLLAAGIPYWTKDEISAQIETINPASKWLIESKDLSCRVQLRRIRAT